MNADDLTARAGRLEQLFRGMCKEAALCKQDDGLLVFAERKAYLTAIQDVIAGTEAARVVLTKARTRIDEQAAKLAAVQATNRR